MYASCICCARDLGRNDVIAAFPVGRRLAFDAVKGRLWVVCPHCGRWNLTPLEERWEAIDEGERLFRATPRRVGSGEIALARLDGGIDLVRVGRPAELEMAAWRYGNRFWARRRRAIRRGVLATGATGAAIAGFALSGGTAAIAASAVYLGSMAAVMQALGSRLFHPRWIDDGAGQFVRITPNELPSVRLVESGAGQWALRLPYEQRRASRAPRARDLIKLGAIGEVTLTGDVGLAAARTLLPIVNGYGAPVNAIDRAVHMLGEWGTGERAFAAASRHVREWGARQSFGDTGALAQLPPEARLALEMAANESLERRAVEGELAALEQAWRDAEEIAAIADDLLLPSGVRAALARLR